MYTKPTARIGTLAFSHLIAFMMTSSLPAGIQAGVGGELPEEFTFVVGDDSGVTIEADFFVVPDGDPWSKAITIVVTPENPLENGTVIPLWEFLSVSSHSELSDESFAGVGIIDWHETILESPFLWGPSPTLVVNGHFVTGEVLENELWFEWDSPVLAPSQIEIHKELIYVGDDIDIEDGETDVRVFLREYPTITPPIPEPGSCFVWSLLGALMIVVRIISRNRKRT